MDVAQFTSSAPGRLVPIQSVPGASHAFIPAPMPPDWTWPDELWPALLEARVALAELKGVGRSILRPELLLQPLRRREAHASSILEGTVTEPKQQLLFEVKRDTAPPSDTTVGPFREVRNLTRALSMRQGELAHLPLSLRLIRLMHGVLMDGVRGQGEAGRFRTYQNQINDPPRFVPPPAADLDHLLDNFERAVHIELPYDPLVSALLFHYQFEAIHPFGDGNGRMGRALLSMMIGEWCDLGGMWLYMSEYFEERRLEYMNRLLAVSTRGEWLEWVDFGLRGATEQARSTIDRSVRAIALHRRYRDEVSYAGGSVRLAGIVDGLFDYPVVRTADLARRFGVTYPTAKDDVSRLVDRGVLEEMSGSYPAAYFAPGVFDIIYGRDVSGGDG